LIKRFGPARKFVQGQNRFPFSKINRTENYGDIRNARFRREHEEILNRLAVAPSVSIAQSKRLMNRALGNTISEQLTDEGIGLGNCAASDDLKEGVRAFVEKRKPQFRGR